LTITAFTGTLEEKLKNVPSEVTVTVRKPSLKVPDTTGSTFNEKVLVQEGLPGTVTGGTLLSGVHVCALVVRIGSGRASRRTFDVASGTIASPDVGVARGKAAAGLTFTASRMVVVDDRAAVTPQTMMERRAITTTPRTHCRAFLLFIS
jgi:hypothetical protein